MLSPLALPSVPEIVFNVGDIAENFGTIVRVEAADDGIRGMLVRIIDGGGNGSRYYADPSKCRPVR